MSVVHAKVAYDGEALELGLMDVRDLAPALLALGELCERSNKVLNGDKAKLTVSVKTGFRPGSFGVDLVAVQSFVDAAKAFLVSDNITAVINLAELIGLVAGVHYSLIKLYKKLKGGPVAGTTLQNGNIQISIEGDVIILTPEVVKLYNDPSVRQAAKKVMAPLQKDGIEVFQVKDEADHVIEQVTKEEAVFFAEEVAIARVTGSDIETVLKIVKPSFDEDLMWMFSDDTGNFYAEIKDVDFLTAVLNRRVRFGRGDLLRVEMHVESFVTETGDIRNTRTITRVFDHVEPPKQIRLLDE